MAKDPAFSFYASDWLGSNRRAMMTLEQQGAYLLLLCRQWSDPTCSLPDDDGALAGLSELGEGWLAIGCPLVRDCFPEHPCIEGRLANKKMLELRAERDEWLVKSSKGGKTSAAKRRAKAAQTKGCGTVKGGCTTLGTKRATKRQPNANTPSPSPSPSNSLPNGKGKPPVVPLDGIAFPDGFDTDPVREAILQWIEYRQTSGKKLKTPVQQIGRLLRRFADGPQFVAAVDYSIAQGYTGCFSPKGDNGPREGVSETERRSLAAGQRWLERNQHD